MFEEEEAAIDAAHGRLVAAIEWARIDPSEESRDYVDEARDDFTRAEAELVRAREEAWE